MLGEYRFYKSKNRLNTLYLIRHCRNLKRERYTKGMID